MIPQGTPEQMRLWEKAQRAESEVDVLIGQKSAIHKLRLDLDRQLEGIEHSLYVAQEAMIDAQRKCFEAWNVNYSGLVAEQSVGVLPSAC